MLGCKHRWQEKERHWAPPTDALKSVKGPGAWEILQKTLFGVTTIVQICALCGKLETTEILGNKLKEE